MQSLRSLTAAAAVLLLFLALTMGDSGEHKQTADPDVHPADLQAGSEEHDSSNEEKDDERKIFHGHDSDEHPFFHGHDSYDSDEHPFFHGHDSYDSDEHPFFHGRDSYDSDEYPFFRIRPALSPYPPFAPHSFPFQGLSPFSPHPYFAHPHYNPYYSHHHPAAYAPMAPFALIAGPHRSHLLGDARMHMALVPGLQHHDYHHLHRHDDDSDESQDGDEHDHDHSHDHDHDHAHGFHGLAPTYAYGPHYHAQAHYPNYPAYAYGPHFHAHAHYPNYPAYAYGPHFHAQAPYPNYPAYAYGPHFHAQAHYPNYPAYAYGPHFHAQAPYPNYPAYAYGPHFHAQAHYPNYPAYAYGPHLGAYPYDPLMSAYPHYAHDVNVHWPMQYAHMWPLHPDHYELYHGMYWNQGGHCSWENPVPCWGVDMCVPLSSVCDKHFDCPNNMDEDVRICEMGRRPELQMMVLFFSLPDQQWMLNKLFNNRDPVYVATAFKYSTTLHDLKWALSLDEGALNNTKAVFQAAKDDKPDVAKNLGMAETSWAITKDFFKKISDAGLDLSKE